MRLWVCEGVRVCMGVGVHINICVLKLVNWYLLMITHNIIFGRDVEAVWSV